MKFPSLDKKSITLRHLILGLLLNILVFIVCFLLYHAYYIAPRLKAYQSIPPIMEEILPERR
jgi:hypothetical protein